ncbi:hypothetical protein Dsin_027284 [Dipteronia sinensis]|uniref:Ankyrin repeat protein n=1 Tax=Dipteronia sinensis TaxID=43782 RepID=A0AAD9ZN80_9ROSI|nr:hypothetical protein Dsin_027284 [Dipteronia sinensis]
MEAHSGQQINSWKKMTKQLTGKTGQHAVAVFDLVKQMIKFHDIAMAGTKSRNGYDAFHIAAKNSTYTMLRFVEIVKQTLLLNLALNVKTFLAFFTLLQSKEIWVLMDAILELSMACDSLNTMVLHASQGHIEMVNFLLEKGSNDSVVAIAKSNAKSALHSAARNGHVEIV